MANKPKEIKKENQGKRNSDTLLICICVAAITLITYFVFSPSLDNGFTNWDDNFYVTDNPLVVTNSVPAVKIFETPVSSNYHPLTVLSLALNYQSGKLDPFGYHLVNVIFHLLNTILVFFFIFLLTRRNLLMAAIVSLFFGIHPMHVESVTWISERKDVLYVFFFLAGLITYLRYSETKKITWYIFTFLLFILSCLSKGMAVVFPVILLLIDYLQGVKRERRVLIEKIPFFFISLVVGIIAFIIQAEQAINPMGAVTVLHKLLFVSYSAIMYIVKLFVPFKLSILYPYPMDVGNGIPLIFYLSPFILIGIIAALIYLFMKKEKEIVFGLLFYFVSVAFVLQFISVGHVIMADRYSYLSYIGLLFIVAHLINKAWQSKSGIWAAMKYPFIMITIIGAFVFSLQTYARTQVWKNSEILWTNVIDNYDDAYMAYYSRGCYYYDMHDTANALSDFNKALELNPSDKYAYYDRGLLYSKYYNKNGLAKSDYTKAIEIDSAYKNALFGRALLYIDNGKFDSAMTDLNMTIKTDPDFAEAYTNRGMVYYNYGKNNSALSDYTKAITLDPAAAEAYNDRGVLYVNHGKNDLALADYDKAIAINPSFVSAFYNRALYYNTHGQFEKAIDDFTRVIQLAPQNADYYNMRAVCCVNLQNYDEAIADFSKAIEINPSVANYWLNRSIIENKNGQNENSKADALKARELQGK